MSQDGLELSKETRLVFAFNSTKLIHHPYHDSIGQNLASNGIIFRGIVPSSVGIVVVVKACKKEVLNA